MVRQEMGKTQFWFVSSRPEFERFVSEWQERTLPKRDWTHGAHVAIAAYHVIDYRDTALERVRNGIIRYNEATGVANTATSGYHETLTRFWLGIVAKILEGFADSFEGAQHAVTELGDKRDLFKIYYSFDVVADSSARKIWIAPDRIGPDERSDMDSVRGC